MKKLCNPLRPLALNNKAKTQTYNFLTFIKPYKSSFNYETKEKIRFGKMCTR